MTPEDGLMRPAPVRPLVIALPHLPAPTPGLESDLDAVRAYADDLEWRVDFLEAELIAEREQRRELELELDSVRLLLGVDRSIYSADVPALRRRLVEDERRDTPPPSPTT